MAEAQKRLREFGPHLLAEAPREPMLRRLLAVLDELRKRVAGALRAMRQRRSRVVLAQSTSTAEKELFMMPMFKDRTAAGEQLASRLLTLLARPCVIAAIPRGGVAV